VPLTMLDRRTLIAAGAATGLIPAAARAARARHQSFEIWPTHPPGPPRSPVTEQEVPRSPAGPADDTAFLHVTRPTLTYLAPVRPNGAALLLIPGGGYQRVAIGHGGRALLEHFADQGYAAYLLKYRLPGDGWAAGPDAPLQDAQRALRHIRARAASAGHAPERIGAMGFSAGGHLAAMLASRAGATYAPVDAIDRQPLGIKVSALLYPVVLMTGAHVHRPSREELLGPSPDPARAERYSPAAAVSPRTPPTFLAHALDDRVVPAENGLAMLSALRSAGVPTEAYLPEIGGHGFGLQDRARAPLPWPGLFAAFAARHGLA